MAVQRSGGTVKVVTGSDPAAGAECSDAVPALKSWRLLAVQLTLVTDSNAATRRVCITLDDGSTVFFRRQSNATQAASLTQNYSFAGEGGEAALRDLWVSDPLPQLILPAASRIRTVTVNKQAADNYGAPIYYVEEFDG